MCVFIYEYAVWLYLYVHYLFDSINNVESNGFHKKIQIGTIICLQCTSTFTEVSMITLKVAFKHLFKLLYVTCIRDYYNYSKVMYLIFLLFIYFFFFIFDQGVWDFYYFILLLFHSVASTSGEEGQRAKWNRDGLYAKMSRTKSSSQILCIFSKM